MTADNCLICLLPCSADVIECKNKHAMHLECFKDMVHQMGKIDCPYCSCHVPAVRALKYKQPSRAKRALVAVEHVLFMLFLLPYVVVNNRSAWRINRKLMTIRLKFDNVSPLDDDIRSFRSFMINHILRVLPTACLSLEFLVKQSAWTWLDAAKVVLMVGSVFQ